MNFDSDRIDEYNKMAYELIGMGSYLYYVQKLDLDLKNRLTPPAKPFVKEQPMLELKKLLDHLRYVLLGEKNTFLVFIVVDLV